MILKLKLKKLTSAKLLVEPNSKEKDFYIRPFKRNNEELKTNIARIDKGKNSDVNAEVSKPMSKTPSRLNKNSEFVLTCHHCHIVGHIRPNCPKLSTFKVRLPSRKHSSSKTTHVCHHCGVSGYTLLIVSSCFLISEGQIGLILCLKALYLFLVSY